MTTTQLLAAGLTAPNISWRVASGTLHRVHRGVYLLGHAVPPPFAMELAALFVCGPAAALSHRSAAAVWRVLPPAGECVEVTVPDRRCRPRPGLRPHFASLPNSDVTTTQGLRLTTPARTLADLRRFLDPAIHERAAHEAQVLRLVATPRDQPGLTRSEAERRLLRLLRRARLTPSATNVRVAGHEVDVLFAEQKLILEVDGYAFHRTRRAFEQDRRRDADLAAAGYRVMRVTWRQMTTAPEAVSARIGAALAVAPPA